MSVNISPLQFKDEALLANIKSELVKNKLLPNTLVLEITEGALMEDHLFTKQFRESLKSLGVLISIDDFGTGYSSFQYLIEFNADVLKIDKSFIDEIVHNHDAQMVANSIKGLAHGLKMKLVAEGVENASQLDYLKRHDFDIVQGYVYAKPCAIEAAGEFLYRKNPPEEEE